MTIHSILFFLSFPIGDGDHQGNLILCLISECGLLEGGGGGACWFLGEFCPLFILILRTVICAFFSPFAMRNVDEILFYV